MAKVVQEHEAQRFVPSQHTRREQARLLHQGRDLHKRLAVFFVGRGVHDDKAAGSPVNPEVTPKTGVGRGDADSFWLQAMLSGDVGQPRRKGGAALGLGPFDGVEHRLG